MRPKKQLGQHFLVNPGAIRAICDAALVSPASTILEIGPGRGAITDFLLKDGRPLWVVELDTDACSYLKNRYGRASNFHIMQGDAVSVDLRQCVEAESRHALCSTSLAPNLCIVGNLPYNAATAILTRLLVEPIPWERMVLMFQLEVGQKLAGRPGEKAYGPLSVLTQSVANLKTLIKLGPGSFNPSPKVDSIVLLFEPKPNAPTHEKRKALLTILHKSFAHRRKTIANNWQSFLSEQQIDSICSAVGISPSSRAESIEVGKWLDVVGAMNDVRCF